MKNKELIGYKNPPKESQFKKGVSGNSKGRPKGKKNNSIASMLEKELNSKLKLKDGTSISKKEAVAKKTVNNLLTTEDLGKSTRAMDVFSRISERENKKDVDSNFLKRLIKENYINFEDAEDYARYRKDPNFNIPKQVYQLNGNRDFKKGIAWYAAKQNHILAMIDENVMRIFACQTYCMDLEEEFRFWDQLDTDLEKYSFKEEDKNEIIRIFQQSRKYQKPSEEINDVALELLEHSIKSYLKMVSEMKKASLSLPFYSKMEKQITKNMKEDEKYDPELFNNIKLSYNSFLSKEEFKEEPDNDLIKEKGSLLMDWMISGIKKKTFKTYEECLKEFYDKFGIEL